MRKAEDRVSWRALGKAYNMPSSSNSLGRYRLYLRLGHRCPRLIAALQEAAWTDSVTMDVVAFEMPAGRLYCHDAIIDIIMVIYKNYVTIGNHFVNVVYPN